MSILNARTINPHLLNSSRYQLAVKNSYKGTTITMSLFTNYYHTDYLPETHDILNKSLPEVLKTQCFNASNLPFHIEVQNTEIGHLFEHIILEYLCQIKIDNGYRRASFRGVTNWNWKKDVRGTFHIKINIKPSDVVFFDDALKKSIKLLNKILKEKEESIN